MSHEEEINHDNPFFFYFGKDAVSNVGVQQAIACKKMSYEYWTLGYGAFFIRNYFLHSIYILIYFILFLPKYIPIIFLDTVLASFNIFKIGY